MIFSQSRVPGKTRLLPTSAQFSQVVDKLRARYPFVTDFAAWNEANHAGQPSFKQPGRGRRSSTRSCATKCPTCNVLPASLLDNPNLVPWTLQLRKAILKLRHARAAHLGPAQLLRRQPAKDTSTRALLAAVKGKVWITESGGVVYATSPTASKFPQGAAYAGKVAKFILGPLIRANPRIERVYFYNWKPRRHVASWDSGLVSAFGQPRPAYQVIKSAPGRRRAQQAARPEEARAASGPARARPSARPGAADRAPAGRRYSARRPWPRSRSTPSSSTASRSSGAARPLPTARARRPCSTCTASRRAATTGTPFLERTGGLAPDLPGLRAQRQARRPASSRWRATTRFVERFLDTRGRRARAAASCTTGAPSGCSGRMRNPERVERLVVINAVPLLPGYRWHRAARVWRTRGLGEVLMGATNRDDAEDLDARGVRRRPGRCPTQFLDEVMAHFDPGTQRAILQLYRASPRAGARRRRRSASASCAARRSSCGATATRTSRRAFAERYAEALGGAGAASRHLPDAGHWPWLDQPELIDEVAAFLADAGAVTARRAAGAAPARRPAPRVAAHRRARASSG